MTVGQTLAAALIIPAMCLLLFLLVQVEKSQLGHADSSPIRPAPAPGGSSAMVGAPAQTAHEPAVPGGHGDGPAHHSGAVQQADRVAMG